MRRHWLKYTRATLAIVVLALLTAAFVDFRGLVDEELSHTLASVQFVPAALSLVTGASLSVAAVVILVATLAFGRVYCSVLCPLGLFQDAVARVASWLRRKPQLLRYAKPATWVRQGFLWASVAGIAAGWAGLTLALLDPYSIFGRFGSMLFRPVVTVVNNWLVGPANAAGLDALYRVPPQWAAAGALAVPAAMLLLIVALAARRGRLYCNTVCPVGTLLGLASGAGAWRLAIDQDRCRKCGDCLRVCKAQCIDLRSGTIDNSRCVACYNCVSACDESGIHHRFSWKPVTRDRRPATVDRIPQTGNPPTASDSAPAPDPSTPPPEPPHPKPETAPRSGDPSRRAFITGTAAALTAATGVGTLLAVAAAAAPGTGGPLGAPRPSAPPRRFGRAPLSPPGSGGIARFLDRCTACQLCVSACPTHVLQPAFLEYGFAGLMKPRLDFDRSFCNFECHRCGEVCPDGAILPLPLEEKKLVRLGVAHIDYRRCIVQANGTDCAACSEHCPTQAVSTVPYGDNLRLPTMHPELCIGCGACEYACPVRPVRAITVKAHAVHSRAERKVEAPATAPMRDDELPF
ncbi:MAG TPA: 4Fe-4S binding protein [Opitutaceae bacterium]|nr:4Fe-4S binding protein [Opitutaceae bacterium]